MKKNDGKSRRVGKRMKETLERAESYKDQLLHFPGLNHHLPVHHAMHEALSLLRRIMYGVSAPRITRTTSVGSQSGGTMPMCPLFVMQSRRPSTHFAIPVIHVDNSGVRS